MSVRLLLWGLCIYCLPVCLFAKVNLPAVFQDHMVLQQKAYAAIWGRAQPGEYIIVSGNWDDATLSTFADSKGKWLVQLPTPAAGGPFEVEIKGENTITLRDVLIGEVWIASGQSNMVWPLKRSTGGETEIAQADLPAVRFFILERELSTTPRFNCKGKWQPSSPETAGNFSGVAYFFAKKLQQQLGVPIGIIQTAWGGSSAEAWIDRQSLEAVSDFQPLLQRFDEAVSLHRAQPQRRNPITHQAPSTLYNAMLAPLAPFAMRGVIWYQGEYNRKDPFLYHQLFPYLIQQWRRYWGMTFPFYYVQIAPFEYPSPLIGVGVREAQRLALAEPNTGMVVSMDVGNPRDIHPRQKKPIGERLALCALANEYGQKKLVHAGPLFDRLERMDGKLKLYFKETGSGLMIKGGDLTHIEVAGEDKKFYPAKAEIAGHELIVFSRLVPNPIAARYGFRNAAEPNLFNREGFPASSFRTDSWPIFYHRPQIHSRYNRDTDDFDVSMTYAGSEPHELYYSLDGKDPNAEALRYQGPFTLKDEVEIRVCAYYEQTLDDWITKQRLFRSLAMKGDIESQTAPNPPYQHTDQRSLIDGIMGSVDHRDGKWKGFLGTDAEIVIDLGSRIPVENIEARFLQKQANRILLPASIEISVSQNGKSFKKTTRFNADNSPGTPEGNVISFKKDVKGAKARYIKVLARNAGPIQTGKAAGKESWILMDEIIIK